MRFFSAVFTLAILVCFTVCQRRGLIFYPEEMIIEVGDGDKQGTVDIDKAADIGEKGRVITEKAVSRDEELRVTTDKPVADDDEKSRVIYPTADGETVRGIRTKDMTKETTKIPESLLIAMNNVHSADEFLRRFVARSPDDGISNNSGSEFWEGSRPGIMSRKGLSGGETALRVTPFAGCQPQKSVVRVDHPEGNGVLLWPPCVYLHRCGGCCTSELMTCRPTATSTVNVTVLQARYTGPQSSPFANEGVRIVTLEQHDRCACGCKELPEDCTDLQEYRKNECRCVCANQDEVTRCQPGANKFWDSHDCACKCRNTRDCSSGLFFNIKTCRCEVLRFSLSSRIGVVFPDRNETEGVERGNENYSNSKENK